MTRLLGMAFQSFATSPQGRQATSAGARDVVLVVLAVAVVIVAFALCVRFFLRPGEADPDHIKRSILDEPHPR